MFAGNLLLVNDVSLCGALGERSLSAPCDIHGSPNNAWLVTEADEELVEPLRAFASCVDRAEVGPRA
jgi:hypothetical protein